MDFSSSKWIWAKDNTVKRDRVVFRRTFALDKLPKSAVVCVSARDTYSFYVNGRAAALGNFGAASFDIAKFLVKGENVLCFDCLYYGIAANGYEQPNVSSGLIVASPDLSIFSCKEFSAFRPYSQDDGEPKPSGRFYGFDSYTDGSRGELGGVFEPDFGSTLFEAAEEYGSGGELEPGNAFDCVYEGLTKVKRMQKTTDGETCVYTCDIGAEKIFYPVIELTAAGTERIDIKSNRYRAHGAWGDSSVYNGIRGVYICRNGAQRYDSPIAYRGSELIIKAPASVGIKTVDLRVVSYPVNTALEVTCDERIVTLIDKCDNTMRACIDGGILDNSDRDRGSELFALSNFARAAIYMYDDSVLPVLRSVIEKAASGEGVTLKNNTGSPFAEERPVSSLMFVSEFGALASYYKRSGDIGSVSALYGKLAKYLMMWNFAGTKLLPRESNSANVDAGFNVDGKLIETCLYYSAVKFLLSVSEAAANGEYANELNERAKTIAENFDANYYKAGYYSSGELCDERANALAVLTGLAVAHTESVAAVLTSCHNASPAFEGFVIEALGAVGNSAAAKSRLIRRYSDSALSSSPVLGEYFYHKGSACSTLAVSAVSAFVSGVMGIRYAAPQTLEFTVDKGASDCKIQLPAGKGSFKAVVRDDTLIAENSTGSEIQITHGGKTETAVKGKTKINL